MEAFADSDKPAPVVATTAELLSTGVDVPAPLSEPSRIVAHLETDWEKIHALKAAQQETDEALKRLERSILRNRRG